MLPTFPSLYLHAAQGGEFQSGGCTGEGELLRPLPLSPHYHAAQPLEEEGGTGF